MTLDTIIMLMGGLVLVEPFLQLPPSWNTPLLILAGVIIMGLGVVVRRRGVHLLLEAKRNPHFVDASPVQSEENQS